MSELKTNEIATRTEQVELTNPNEIMSFATSLKDLIVKNGLYTKIKGKNYVNVEGWQIAGAFTGVFPIIEKVEALESPAGTYKYRAEVSLQNIEGNKVGYGVAICSNREAGKGNFDEYAVASMAQTRATGKAFRMKLGWLLKVAGYETTPAEEMPIAQEAEVISDNPETPTERNIGQEIKAKSRLVIAKTLEELKNVWEGLPKELQNNRELIELKDKQKSRLERPQAVTATRGGESE